MPFWHFFMFPRLDYDGNWNRPQEMTAEEGFWYYTRLQGCPKVSKIAQSLHNATCCYFVIEALLYFSTLCIHNPLAKKVTGIAGHLVKQLVPLRLAFITQPFYMPEEILFAGTCAMTTSDGVCFTTSHVKNQAKFPYHLEHRNTHR